MKILFDHGTPAPLRRHLPKHSVDRSAERGWELLENGELIIRAEEEGYEVIVTTDQSMRYQQNLAGRKFGDRGSDGHRLAQDSAPDGGNPGGH